MRALLLAIALLPGLALAQAETPTPRLLPYQGRLLRAGGAPEAGTPRLTFRIYDTATGGTALWSETQSVPLTNGFYAVFLGSVASFPETLFDGRDRWVTISVDDGPELLPRQQIGSVAYAITATNAFVATTAARAASADRAMTAALADKATSADQATRAERAAHADTASNTSRADHALSADEASLAHAVEGPVNATTIIADSVSTATLQTGTSVITESLQVEGTASFRNGISGAGSVVMAGYVDSDGTVRTRVGDEFAVARIDDGSGHYRVTASNLTGNSIVLVTLGNAVDRYGFPCIERHDGFFEVQLRGLNSDRVDDPWSFVVLGY